MKNLFLAVILLVPVLLFSQNPNKEINRIYNSVDRGEDIVKLKIPGFVVRTALRISSIAAKQNNKIEIGELVYSGKSELMTRKELRPIIKAIRGINILVVEDKNKVPTKKIKKSLTKLHSNKTIEDLIKVQSEGSDINIMVAEKNGKIRNLIIIVAEDEELVMLNLKMKMSNHMLDHLIEIITNDNGVEKIDLFGA